MNAKSLLEIAAAIGGEEAAGALRHPHRQIDMALTDSRSVITPESTLFFALATDTNDGHRYIPALLRRGVRAFVVSRIPEGCNDADADFLVTDSPLDALGRLAAAHRRLCSATTVIAVGGSRGKTLVKEGLYAALNRVAPSVRSPRSWNSRVGVPLSLLEIDPALHRYAVIEAGISTRGEMQRLNEMIAPDVAVITNVLPGVHDEGFASLGEKKAEKMLLAHGASKAIAFSGIENPLPRESNSEICRQTLSALGLDPALVPDRLPEIETRIDVTQALNNCLLITDRFTPDLPSLLPALDFMNRRRTTGAGVTLIMDPLTDFNAAELARLLNLYAIDRLVGFGNDYRQLKGVTRTEIIDPADFTPGDLASELILAKGAPGGEADRVAERLKARHHETVLEVNLDAIVHNFNHFKAMVRPSTGIVAMVKASGYGAGSYELAKTLQSHGAAYLAVAVTDEGEELRNAGITMPIMVLNPKVTNYSSLFANRLEPEIFSFEMLREIIAEAEKRGITDYPIHIKFDTGMHRLGFLRDDIPALADVLNSTSTVTARSIFSHLATADCLDMDDYTLSQLRLFDQICAEMQQRIGNGFLRHILNSAGIARFPQWQYDMVRLGISLYGVDTLGIPQTAGLKPVSALRSIIISLKRWPAGTSIGYARRTVLDHDAIVATVPVGYADGLNRRLGNGAGHVMVRGARCPIVGNVCMDACMVDVTAAEGVSVGDSVEFFGGQISVNSVAEAIGTIPYEVLTAVSPRVKRVYFRE